MTHSTRFKKIAQLLFTSEISDDELAAAKHIVDILDKNELDLQSWLETIENNLKVFNDYHGSEKSMVVISEKFEEVQKKQKEKYERIIAALKEAIEAVNKIQDVEMQDMITNLTKSSEDFSEVYNELTDMPLKIGESGFIQKFKEVSQRIIDSIQSFFDVIQRVKDYVMKNILGEQALS